MAREFVEVETLKMVPAVPVETLVRTLAPKVIWVEVPIKTLWPPVMDRPDPTVREPKVVVPSPPLETGSMPETSEEPKAIAPLNRAPPAVERTGRAWFKLVMVVEPVTVSKFPPVKVKLEEVATGLVPLPNRMSLAVKD